MNTFSDFSLESLLNADDVAMTKPQPRPRHALPRVLLASAGTLAGSVCSRAMSIAGDWLAVEPPMAHWEAGVQVQTGAADGQAAAMAELLDRLARRKVAANLQLAGYELQNPEELQGWVVVSSETGDLPDPVLINHAGGLMRQLAWSRMRAQVTLKVLALVEPADDGVLAQLCSQVAAVTQAIHLCSPVNLRHLRLEPDDYREQAATALAALLCGNFPSHAREASAPCLAIGAVAWTAPLAEIRRGLGLLSAMHSVGVLRAELEAGGVAATDGANSDSAVAHVPGLEQSDLELAGAVSPVLPAARWRDLGLGWEDLTGLRARVEERLDRREDRHEQTLIGDRHAWLDQHIALWGGILGEVDRLLLPDSDGPPPLRLHRLNLQLLHARLAQDLEALAVALESSEQRLQVAEDQVEMAWARVEKLRGQIPAATTKGILLAAVQPWMWPIWPYAFATLLPQEGQKVLDSVAYRSKVRWHDANWHILRQAAQAMSQDVKRRQRRLEQLEGYAAALHTYLQEQMAQLALPAPWTTAALYALWAAATAHAPALAAFPRQEQPIDWPAEAAAHCAERLAASYVTATAFVDQWTVLDCLAQPFLLDEVESGGAGGSASALDAAPAEPAPPAACITWLSSMAEAALPLWPDQALAPVAGPVGWCLLPEPVAGVADSGYGPDSIRHWCEAVANLAPATLAGQTLALLRWAPVEVREIV